MNYDLKIRKYTNCNEFGLTSRKYDEMDDKTVEEWYMLKNEIMRRKNHEMRKRQNG